jgi:serine protease Do
MRANNWFLTLAAIALLAVGTSVALDWHPVQWLSQQPEFRQATGARASDPVKVAEPAVPAAPLPPGQAPNYRAIVQQQGPAVVGVTVAGQHVLGSEDLQLDLNDPFFQFFRGLPGLPFRLPPGAGGQGAGSVPFRGQGSGFIIASDGLILTNAHVVREAKEVTIKLSDRREFRARVLGEDPTTDIAVLRIDARNLPTVRLGDAQLLQVGDPVLAIGSPFGFEQTATQGIVSAKGRSLPGDTAVPFIQTDAAVNPGNSGGPLFDAVGNVVGINAQILSRSGGFQGLSFAIPIGVALRVKDQILATGHAQHARLGVAAQDLSQGLADSFGLSRPDGALVTSVQESTAAASAGLQAGDVITAVNGEPITHASDLSSRISMAVPGETVQLKVWRERAERTLTVKLGQAEEAGTAAAVKAPPMPPKAGELGLSLRPLTRQEQAAAHVTGGLLIEGAAGPAARAGLDAGDVLLAINGVSVNAVEQVQRELAKKPKSVALLILHEGNRIFVPVELG